MDDALLTLLRSVDTPTVCNAIEVAQGQRGFANFTRGTMIASAPEAGAIVGYARTAKIAATEPPSEPADVIRARRMAYYRHMAAGPRPGLAVIEDVDPMPLGAFWGEVNTNVHQALGLSGALTNGVMRDLGDLPDGFGLVAGSIGPSHGFVHVREIGCPVSIFGMDVADGDLVHADRHGALVVPAESVAELSEAIAKMQASEAIILDAVRGKTLSIDAFETAWAAFEAARQ